MLLLLLQIASVEGLYSKQYGKGVNTAVVVSTAALPNYRADLDPNLHRQGSAAVSMDQHTQQMMHGMLSQLQQQPTPPQQHQKQHHEKKDLYRVPSERRGNNSNNSSSISSGEELRVEWEQLKHSPQYQKMLKFRQKLPAFQQRESLLEKLRQHQVRMHRRYCCSLCASPSCFVLSVSLLLEVNRNAKEHLSIAAIVVVVGVSCEWRDRLR